MSQDFNRKTQAQIQREMQDRQFAAAHALEIRRWHRDVAREIFIKRIDQCGGIPTALADEAVAAVNAADHLLSAIMARPAETITEDQAKALNDAIAKKEIPLSEFLDTFEISAVDQLPAAKFDDAMASIIL